MQLVSQPSPGEYRGIWVGYKLVIIFYNKSYPIGT